MKRSSLFRLPRIALALLMGAVPTALTQAAIGTVDFHLWADAAATVVVDGDSSTMTLNAGQIGFYTFSGTAGDWT